MATYEKGTWDDRVSENSSRRSLTIVSYKGTGGLTKGDVITADVVRADSKVSTIGTAFNHENMDDLETRIQNKFKEVKGVTILFNTNETNGRKTDFVLSAPCNNFDYIGAYFVAPGGQLSGYTEINGKDNTELCCSISYPSATHDSWIIRAAYLHIPDYKNVVFKRNGYLTIHIDGTNNTISTNTSETIGIKRIVGYKL